MRFTRLIFAPLLALSPVAVFAQEDNSTAISEAESADLATALQRGKAIYRYDQAAWHTTDTLMKDITEADIGDIRGWVVVEDGDALKVTYWKPEGESYAAVYSANFGEDGVSGRIAHSSDDGALSEEQIALINASQTVDSTDMFRCSDQRWNRVVMPSGKENGSTFVYLLTPLPGNGYPLGGHYRYEVLDGEVLNLRAFSRICDLLLAKDAETGERPNGYLIEHILDPIPTEIHVFALLSSRVPLFVDTLEPARSWALGIKNGEPTARLVD